MRRIRLGASVVVLVASLIGLVTAAPAQADYGRPVRSGLNPSHLCLDVRGGIAAAGQDVQIWDCNNGPGQRWILKSDGTIVSDLDYREIWCLDVRGGVPAAGQDVQLWRCNGGAGQHWHRNDNGTLTSDLNPDRLCLDVRGGIGAAGQDVQIWDCNGGANQRWYV